ncbi:hypothetical protein A3Q56_08013, partial [Intoshia linei]
MNNLLPKPKPLMDENGVLTSEWIQEFELMMQLDEAVEKESKNSRKLTLLKIFIGSEARKRLDERNLKPSYNFYKDDILKWKIINVSMERLKFNKIIRPQHESTQSFISRLYKGARNCQFVDKNERIRDQLLCGIENNTITMELLIRNSLKLSDRISICQKYDSIFDRIEFKGESKMTCFKCHKPGHISKIVNRQIFKKKSVNAIHTENEINQKLAFHNSDETKHFEENIYVKKDIMYIDHNGKSLILVPKQHFSLVIQFYHQSVAFCHPRLTKTFYNIRTKYFWSYMYRDIKEYIEKCID